MSETATEFVAPSTAIEVDKPEIMLWRILIKPYEPPKQSKGGILIADSARENMKYLTQVGKVIAVGELAYRRKAENGQYSEPFCGVRAEAGDWVIYQTYAGARVKRGDGEEFIILNDDEILCRVQDPSQYVTYI